MNSTETRNWREIYGFLPDWAIVNMIREQVIEIDPLGINWEKEVGTMSVDFHLGRRVQVSNTSRPIDVRVGVKPEDYKLAKLSSGDTYKFAPGVLAVAEVQEHLKLPDGVVGFVEGRSSLARLGFVVHLTAGRFDPGWDGTPVMEFLNNGNREIEIPYGWPVCTFTFFRLMASTDRPYFVRGRYNGVGTIHSLVERNAG